MPVQIGTIDGKVDYVVVNAIKQLTTAVNALETQVGGWRADLTALEQQIATLQREQLADRRLLQQIQQQVTTLQQAP